MGAESERDILGNELTSEERRLLSVYRELKELCREDGELPPTASANARAALAVLAQAVNSLALVHEHGVEGGAGDG